MTSPDEREQELQREIEQTRVRLGETVEQLAAKADLTGRAKAKLATQNALPLALAAISLLAGYLALRWWRQR